LGEFKWIRLSLYAENSWFGYNFSWNARPFELIFSFRKSDNQNSYKICLIWLKTFKKMWMEIFWSNWSNFFKFWCQIPIIWTFYSFFYLFLKVLTNFNIIELQKSLLFRVLGRTESMFCKFFHNLISLLDFLNMTHLRTHFFTTFVNNSEKERFCIDFQWNCGEWLSLFFVFYVCLLFLLFLNSLCSTNCIKKQTLTFLLTFYEMNVQKICKYFSE
jgi:hypothetical protein